MVSLFEFVYLGAKIVRAQVELLSRVHHKNLVSLLGYCQEDSHQILVYEFVQKGTVREHLYGMFLQTGQVLRTSTNHMSVKSYLIFHIIIKELIITISGIGLVNGHMQLI
jgi:serine/threonine protein kinase